MTDVSPLSIAFIERRPDAAARVLENLEVDDAAALIDALPARISGLALGRMMPFAAAQCLALLDPDRAAHVLRAMLFLEAAGILRILDEDVRDTVMKAMPKDLSRDFKKSLSHPRDSVGAWMDQRISPLPHTRTVTDALKYAKRKRRPEGDELFVVDDARRYLGVVKISELVQYDGKAILKNIIKKDAPTISNRASLASVIGAIHWDNHRSLAVVGRKGNFLGILTLGQARGGLAAARRRPVNLTANSVLTHLLTGFFVTLVGLLGLILHSADIPSGQPIQENGHDR